MFLRNATVTLLGLLAIASVSNAQGAVAAPPSSAFNWLNLNRSGNTPAANYYGIVRPNNMTQNALMNFQQEFNNLSQSSTNTDPNGMRGTGHAATFMNYGHYYPRLGTGGSAGRPGIGTQGMRR